MAKKHWKHTEQNLTAENVAQDINEFINTQIGLSVGWEIEERIEMIGYYNGTEFALSVAIPTDKTNLYQIQKEVYDYCKSWNKA